MTTSSTDDATALAWQRCRDAFGDIAVPCEMFSSYLAARRSADVTEELQLATYCLDDLYLACACLARVPLAIARFERDVLPCVEPVLARWHPAVADETRQQLRAMLLVDHQGRGPLLSTYLGRGPLRRWIRVVAAREAGKTWRASKDLVAVDDDELFDVLAPARDPAMSLVKTEAAEVFRRAFVAVLGSIERRERALLRLHFLDELTIDEIAPIYGVHRATIARWIAAAKDIVLAETRTRLRSELGISAVEVESLIRLVRSRIELGPSLLASRK